MLVEFSVKNFASFNGLQKFSFLPSSSPSEKHVEESTIRVDSHGVDRLLNLAAIFGANASGKSNFVNAINIFKNILLHSQLTANENTLNSIQQFVLQEEKAKSSTEFEVVFFAKDKLFRYGILANTEEILEEWLYFTPRKRETRLFHREFQNIKFNTTSFIEANDFVERNGKTYSLKKTRKNVPFVSVLSQFDGQISTMVVDWFKKVRIISGLSDGMFEDFTINLFESDAKFKEWALKILYSVQIEDLKIVPDNSKVPDVSTIADEEFRELVGKLMSFLDKQKIDRKSVEVVKYLPDSDKPYVIPLKFESAGTKRLFSFLGPLYNALTEDRILIVDEFDSKFHALLSKFILGIYRLAEKGKTQLLITCHDTNLLSPELFRRDQIWFVEKNSRHESQIYSLLEYKEIYVRKDEPYNKNYLMGKYGAIPLFDSIENLSRFSNES